MQTAKRTGGCSREQDADQSHTPDSEAAQDSASWGEDLGKWDPPHPGMRRLGDPPPMQTDV